jgi:enterochelin esterase-like enzyme
LRHAHLALVGAVAAASIVTGLTTVASASTPSARERVLSPQVIHTAKAPTGYTVTFRYKDPTATSVQIKGEWYFANPYQLSALAGTKDNVIATPGLLPAQWQPGDIPIGSPNSSAANWPVTLMKRDRDGIWSYTTPLPSGVFTYGFFVNCASPTQTGCTEISDPSNPPWRTTGSNATLSVEPTSQVYVPFDPTFKTLDSGWLAPNRDHGTLTDVTYPAPTSTTPAGQNYLAVYTPPGYDPQRAKPYPTVYLFSGGSNEIDWSTQGDVGNILDNLIDTGEIQPMVVVMPSAQGFPTDADYATYAANVINSVVPYVEARYHVSTASPDRAAGGLGYGASVTNALLFHDTDEFGYYGAMSPGVNGSFTLPAPSAITPAQVAAMRQVGIFVGGGWQDPSHYYHAQEVATLVEAGVPVTPDYVNGGHSWYAWRILVKDFLTRVAFFPR